MSTSRVPSTRLILVAHAATAATRRAAFPGPDDLPETADLAATARLVLPPASIVLAAPAPAARRTAEALGLVHRVEPALRDLGYGRWAGAALAAMAPEEIAAWTTDPHFTDHGGESLAHFVERLRAFLRTRLQDRGTTLAIAHGAVLRAALLAVLDAPFSAFWRIEAPPLATLALGTDGRRWSLRGIGPA